MADLLQRIAEVRYCPQSSLLVSYSNGSSSPVSKGVLGKKPYRGWMSNARRFCGEARSCITKGFGQTSASTCATKKFDTLS